MNLVRSSVKQLLSFVELVHTIAQAIPPDTCRFPQMSLSLLDNSIEYYCKCVRSTKIHHFNAPVSTSLSRVHFWCRRFVSFFFLLFVLYNTRQCRNRRLQNSSSLSICDFSCICPGSSCSLFFFPMKPYGLL